MITLTSQPPAIVFWTLNHEGPVGSMLVAFTQSGELCRLSFLKKRSVKAVLAEWQKAWPKTVFVKGEKPIGKWPQNILLVGTDFQHKVWAQLMKIPSGETISYGEMARRIGNPFAARAVGGALRANPVPWLVPCHRVIRSDGSIGGYAGSASDTEIKKLLLKSEGVVCKK